MTYKGISGFKSIYGVQYKKKGKEHITYAVLTCYSNI